MSFYRCMGVKKYKSQCDICSRLPETAKEEDGVDWLDPGDILPSCSSFKERKVIHASIPTGEIKEGN